MAKNDEKVKELLAVIEAKKKTMGARPKVTAWKSNGILKFGDGSHLNINVAGSVEQCVEAVAYLLQKQSFLTEASKLLGVKYAEPSIEEYIQDFKVRTSMIVWDGEKKKLDVLESKLKDLRSEDAKTEDALSDITQALN